MTGFTIHLPMPPSVNSIWRTRVTRKAKPIFYLSRQYAEWRGKSDKELTALGENRPKKVCGHFNIDVALSAKKRRGDADNRMKAVLDWLARADLIENDKLADSVRIYWGPTGETGCIVTVTPVAQAEAA